MIITDFNVTDLVFKNLPEDKEVILVAHGDIYQFDSNFYINGIFKENYSNEYSMSFLPLKILSAYPLGMIFKNQKIIDINKVSRIKETTIKLEKRIYKSITAKELPVLSKYIDRIPDTIDGYNFQNKIIKNQNYLTVKDNNEQTIIFPHYEIARWFYFRSSSMTRQVLSCYLEGLFKSYKYYNQDKSDAEIILKYGASNADVSEIFRFAADEYANIMFHNISIDLSSNYKNIKGYKDFNRKMKLQVNFPIYGDINFKLRGFYLDKNTFYVYQILEENSLYPYTNLYAFREVKPRDKSKPVPFAKIKKNVPTDEGLNPIVTNIVPSPENEILEIEKDNYLLYELRKDLENKRIKFLTIIDDDPSEIELEKQFVISGVDINLSLNNNDLNGDENTAKLNIINTIKENETGTSRESKKLDLFKEMIINCSKECKNFSFIFYEEQLIPLKPDSDKSRSQYKKAKLKDETTRRKYMFVNINYKNIDYCIVEIEKDKLLDKLSTLIIRRVDKSIIEPNIVQDIVKGFVKDNGVWFKNYKNESIINIYLNHPDFDNKDSIKNWTTRLIQKLDS